MQLDEESEDIGWFKIPRRYLSRYIPEDMAVIMICCLKLPIDSVYPESGGLATRFLPEYYFRTNPDIYGIWEVELSQNFREKLPMLRLDKRI